MDRHEDDLSTRDIAGSGAMTPDRDSAGSAAMAPDRDSAVEQHDGELHREPGEDHPADAGPLLGETDQSDFQNRWAEIQTRFVDDPRRAVEDADGLVAALMKRLADGFADEREGLESVWGRGEDVGTEDLRVALQRYRAFFHRLLST